MTQAKRTTQREMIEQGSFYKPWDCWLWQHSKNHKGYGQVRIAGVTVLTHRYSYAYHVEPIPTGLVIDHVCHNRACYNPYHLRAVTNKQNTEYKSGLAANNTSGYRGVSYNRRQGKWQARVKHDGKYISCGYFNCPTKAGLAAAEKRKELGFLGS